MSKQENAQIYFRRVADVLTRVPQAPIAEIIGIMQQTRADGRRIFMFGNGGSSANASHIVNDILKSTARPDRPRFKIACLSDNVPTLTAYANDVGYEVVFAEQLAALAGRGDVAFALSGSGDSPNVLAAMETARELGLICIGLTGRDGGRLKDKCDVCLIVPSDSMQIIEDVHLVTLHAIFLALCEDSSH
jgi:D-sedoheptulose 7-phosphate isomerase